MEKTLILTENNREEYSTNVLVVGKKTEKIQGNY